MSRVLVIGFAIGTILSTISTRALADKLEGLGATNPLVLIAVIAVLALAALTACTPRPRRHPNSVGRSTPPRMTLHHSLAGNRFTTATSFLSSYGPRTP